LVPRRSTRSTVQLKGRQTALNRMQAAACISQFLRSIDSRGVAQYRVCITGAESRAIQRGNDRDCVLTSQWTSRFRLGSQTRQNTYTLTFRRKRFPHSPLGTPIVQGPSISTFSRRSNRADDRGGQLDRGVEEIGLRAFENIDSTLRVSPVSQLPVTWL
jgi:hypothetical protein